MNNSNDGMCNSNSVSLNDNTNSLKINGYCNKNSDVGHINARKDKNMNKPSEEIYNGARGSSGDTTNIVQLNGYYKNNHIECISGMTDSAALHFNTIMDVISEMMKKLQIAPQPSDMTGDKSKNYLFSNKLNKANGKNEFNQELSNGLENDKNILNTRSNFFTFSTTGPLFVNSLSCKPSTNKFRISNSANTTCTIPHNTQEASGSTSVFVFGSSSAQSSMINPKSFVNTISSISNSNNDIRAVNKPRKLALETIQNNAKVFNGEITQTVSLPIESSKKNCLAQNTTIEPPPMCDASATSTDRRNISSFNSNTFKSMFRDSWKIGTSTIESTGSSQSPSEPLNPFRNKFTMSYTLMSKKTLFSQKKLLKNSSIANVEFTTVKPTFSTAHKNTESFYIFGGQNTPESIFNQQSSAKSMFGTSQATKNTGSEGSLFRKKELMSLFAGKWNVGSSTTQTSTLASPEVTSPFRNKFVTSATLISKKKLFPQNNSTKIESNSSSMGSVKYETVIPTFSSSCNGNAGYFVSAENNVKLPVFEFGGPDTLICIRKTINVTSKPKEENTSSTQDISSKNKLKPVFNSKNEGLQKTASPFSQNKKLQLETRPTGRRKIELDLYKYKDKDYKTALAMFVDAIRLCPDNVTFVAYACHYNLKDGNYKEAVNHAQQVIAYDPNFTYGYIWLGKCYIALGNVLEAVAAITKAGVIGPCGVDERAALEEAEHLLQLYKDIQRDISLQNFVHAIASADEFLKLCPSNRVKAIKAMCLAFNMELEQAMAKAETCLQTDRMETEALYAKGLCHYFYGQLPEAADYFEQVLRIFPLHMGAIDSLQKTQLFITLEEQAKEALKAGDYKKVIMLNNSMATDKLNKRRNVTLYWDNAEMYSKLNNIQLAIQACTSALEQNESSVRTLRKRARYYRHIGKYEAALRDVERCYDIDKRQYYSNLVYDSKKLALEKEKLYNETLRKVDSLIKNDKCMEALKLVDESLPEYTCDGKVLYTKGWCFFCLEQFDKATELFQQVLIIEPMHTQAQQGLNKSFLLKNNLQLGNTAFADEQWSLALFRFKESLKLCEDNRKLSVRLHCKNGSIFCKLDQLYNAIDSYTNAILLDSKCTEALRGRSKCYTELGKHEQALDDCTKLYAIDDSDEAEALLRKARSACNSIYAQRKLAAGHKFYKQKQFKYALDMYKEARQLCPDVAEYYSFSFSCHMKLSMLKDALVDAKKAVELAIKCTNKVHGIAKCYIFLGDLSGAERAIVKASETGEECEEERRTLQSLQKLHAQTHKHIEERNYERAVSCMDQCLESSPFSSKVKLIKAECLAKLGKIDQAQEIADECIRCDRSDIEALYVKGLCIYYQEKLEQAMKYFKEVLRLSPDHKAASAAYNRAKLLRLNKEKGNEEFKMNRWQSALHLYNEALKIDTTHAKINAKLHFNKATAYARLNETQAAAEACTAALDLDHDYVKALALRAKCFSALQEYECAVDDYERLYRLDPGDHNKKLLDDAKTLRTEKSRDKTYYNILGVARNASKHDIVKAYRQLALVHHPDRHSDRSLYERKRQERRFKEVLEAYNVLSDPVERTRYDAQGSRYERM